MKFQALFTVLFGVIMVLIPPAGHTDEQQGGLQVGIVTCSVIPGSKINLLIHSTANVECVYENHGQTEKYVGETGIGLGVDLHFKTNEKFGFAVIAASADVQPGAHALAGKYFGGTAGASAGVGLTASALIGGGDKNISLQPLSLGTDTGIGASAGLGYLYLQAAK